MSIARAIAATFLGVSVAACVHAASRTCPVSDDEFFRELSIAKDWSSIHAIFRRNTPNCADDGAYGEGYTEAVVVTLAKRWSDFPELERLMRKDPSFRTFVYRHIDASASVNDLREVVRNAEAKCAAELERECAEISKRARVAIKEAE